MSDRLDQDPRWLRLHARDWLCPCCGQKHGGVFDLACDRPDFWQGGESKPNSEIRTSNNVLTEDFCILNGEHFFVRCVLPIAISGTPDTSFRFGTWATLSRANFDHYVDNFDGGQQGNLGPWFGWFSNRLKGYPNTLGLKCRVHPRDGRQRPNIELEPTDHALAMEQKNGISFDRLLDLYALNGHDIRDALSAY
jgi:hypothetical protein